MAQVWLGLQASRCSTTCWGSSPPAWGAAGCAAIKPAPRLVLPEGHSFVHVRPLGEADGEAAWGGRPICLPGSAAASHSQALLLAQMPAPRRSLGLPPASAELEGSALVWGLQCPTGTRAEWKCPLQLPWGLLGRVSVEAASLFSTFFQCDLQFHSGGHFLREGQQVGRWGARSDHHSCRSTFRSTFPPHWS